MSRGLSVDGSTYFSDFMEGEQKPAWMQFGQAIAPLVGDFRIASFLTGFPGLTQFYFRTPKWPIGGMYFDGILRSEHTSRVRPTTYPVQTGVTMTDHAVIEPAELTVEVMMTDTASDNLMGSSFIGAAAGALFGGKIGGIIGTAFNVYDKVKNMQYSNFTELVGKLLPVVSVGSSRSVDAWQALKTMQLSRVPITVETRLQTYNNMLIEELSAPDDVQTLHALKCTVRMRQIIFAGVAETEVSARPASSAPETTGGSQPVNTDGVNSTVLGGTLGPVG